MELDNFRTARTLVSQIEGSRAALASLTQCDLGEDTIRPKYILDAIMYIHNMEGRPKEGTLEEIRAKLCGLLIDKITQAEKEFLAI